MWNRGSQPAVVAFRNHIGKLRCRFHNGERKQRFFLRMWSLLLWSWQFLAQREGMVSENQVMTKAKIIDIVAEGTGLTKTETAAVVDGFLATINWSVSNGTRVMLRGFGSFHPVQRGPRVTRNPRTGESITVPAHRAVVFRPAKELREGVKQNLPEEKPAAVTS
jgi:nucleoid DNA-binding protein